MHDLRARALAMTWFYPLRLPSGETTPTYDDGALDQIHPTRTQMLDAALDQEFGGRFEDHSAPYLARHQGWFSAHLAQRGFAHVHGVDARA